jgi:hypothetical protein
VFTVTDARGDVSAYRRTGCLFPAKYAKRREKLKRRIIFADTPTRPHADTFPLRGSVATVRDFCGVAAEERARTEDMAVKTEAILKQAIEFGSR